MTYGEEKPLTEMTMEELVAEHKMWDDKITGADSWGAAVGAAAEFRADCAREIRRRERATVGSKSVPVLAVGDEPKTATEVQRQVDAALETAVEDAVRPATRFPVYVASRVNHAGMWKDLRRKWRAQDVQIVSTWIDSASLGREEGYTPLFLSGEWIQNYRDVQTAKAVVCYVETRDNDLRGALVEAGIAMGMHKPVLIVGDLDHRSWGSWQYHPLVSACRDLESALTVLHTWMGRRV